MSRQVPTPRTVEIPSAEAVAKERERLQYKKKYNRTLRSTIYALLVVAALAVLVATIFLPVLQVSGTSMEPTLADGDIILLLKSESFTTGDICGLYWQNKLLLKRIIALRGDVNAVLEAARAEKRIGKALEAHVTLQTADEDLKKACAGLNLAEICIVSDCTWTAPEEGAEVAAGVNFPQLTVGVSEAKGTKCPRCWMHSVNANAEGLCPRCAAVIAKMDVEL